ncbi:MAG: flagellar hook-basal body complex protein FliE [Firmicutes bacterium]|nr:flagellar hook-basal body complex protein FliE [Bacillota bacterium]
MIQPIGNLSPLIPVTNSASTSAATGTGSAQGGFASALAKALDSVNSAIQGSQEQGIALAAGTAPSIASVMESATQAQLAIDLTVQVRDRVVQAYNQIMSMQV